MKLNPMSEAPRDGSLVKAKIRDDILNTGEVVAPELAGALINVTYSDEFGWDAQNKGFVLNVPERWLDGWIAEAHEARILDA